ncbi:MAG: ABC transporter ATP-binding protein [Clostridia bacterium]|nr:ABC transporter ATP-binding protein [Clostridia bacterium]
MKIDDNELYQQSWDDKEKLISIKGVTKSFKNGEFTTQVLKGINLDIYKGEFVVLLGESGCGKSTLLNIIGGMDNLDDGTVLFDGQELSKATDNQLTEYRRDYIGFIFQSYNLMPNLNVKENLDLISELVKNPLDSLEALDLVGLKEKASNYPWQLSGGQQQRVSIARALVKNPTLILADEPTAALDYETSIEVLSVLEQVYKKGSTLIMVTHNEEISKMANRVIKIRGGKVHEIKINRYPAKATDLVW